MEKIIVPTQQIAVPFLGKITANFYDQRTLSSRQKLANEILERKLDEGVITRKQYSQGYILGKNVATDVHKNVICNAGFSAITKILAGDVSYLGNGAINKALLGDGVGAVAPTRTQLINEVYRNDLYSATSSNNIMYATIIFTETEVVGTFKEFGNCIDGLAGENTGLLWSHLSGLNWVKDDVTALVVSCEYSLASV